MTPHASERSPLARLVLFMVCLSIAGSILAGIHYVAVDQPQQKALEAYAQCSGGCVSANVVISTPYGASPSPTDETCQRECRDRYLQK